jgi:hypothetical protein
VHPDGTAAIANYTGQSDSGQGWAGNADGEGGPERNTTFAKGPRNPVVIAAAAAVLWRQ